LFVHVGEDDDSLYKLINPRIIATGETVLSEEGCLSLPGIRESIFRYNEVTVVAQTVDGEEITIEAEGLLAFCFQHEIDHLDGVLFIDHLSKLKKKLVAAKLKKLRREK
jgi:peptide deformylase